MGPNRNGRSRRACGALAREQGPLARSPVALPPPFLFPDLRALASLPPPAEAEGEAEFRSCTLLSALAPPRLARALRPAYGELARSDLLAALDASYASLGLGRKKVFGVGDLRALVESDLAERDAWADVARTGKLDRVAPLLAYVGRRLDAEAEVAFPSGKAVRFADVEKKRPGKLRVALDGGGLLGISLSPE